jgi:dTMP kinase
MLDKKRLVQVEKTNRHGIFICIEGIDGSGKTTQAHRLVKRLKKKSYDAVYTTEPSKGTYGKIIRKHILQGKNRVPTVVEATLFAADRIDHGENEIKPLLKTGKIIVCDRYVYSSIAYQGASNLDLEWIKEINKHAIKPDLAIYIDVPPEIVINRIKRRKTVMETLQTQKRVRELYLKLVKEKQLVMVDGNAPMKEVAEDIENIVLKFLRSH